MFGPQHLTHLIAYFDGIDAALSQRMLRKHAPDEPALTNELCALLDADTQRSEGRPSYTVDHLNADLSAVGDGLDVEVTIDTYPHNSAMERHVSQSDFGLVLEYENRILPWENWYAAYLVQAKKLFRNSRSDEYDGRSRFQAIKPEQQRRLERLSNLLGPDALLYCLYCPPTAALPDLARMQVRALHTRNLSDKIFDFATGLSLRDAITANRGIDAGVWLHPVDIKPTGLIDLHSRAFNTAFPLTWFAIQHFSPRGMDVRVVRRDRPGNVLNVPPEDRLKRIVTGDESAVKELIEQLAEAGEDSEPPEAITVLPRHTMTIKVTVGKALDPDLAALQVG